jgi:hypothetical protein
MRPTRRSIGALVCVAVLVSSTACTDDRVTLRRGPLGPASYELRVSAQGQAREGAEEEHRATLAITPAGDGANFVLRTTEGEFLTAELRFGKDGSANLARVRGGVTSGQELASLVGQLNPPLPSTPVRLGKRWSSAQRISTQTLRALLRTTLRIVRFRRVASTDAAELVGDVSGTLRVTGGSRTLSGRLSGTTRIVWAVDAGRVVAADTDLVWTLGDGNRVTLGTVVRPR